MRHTIEDFRKSRVMMKAEDWFYSKEYGLLDNEGDMLAVYGNCYYIEIIKGGIYMVTVLNKCKTFTLLEVAEQFLWDEFVEDEFNN